MSGTGRVKSAAIPKSAQMRARMSLIESVPNACLELGRTPPVVALQRMVAQVDEAAVDRASGRTSSSATQPVRPSMRSARSAWDGERATSHASSPSAEARSMSAWTAGSDTTRSPRPNDTGAT